MAFLLSIPDQECFMKTLFKVENFLVLICTEAYLENVSFVVVFRVLWANIEELVVLVYCPKTPFKSFLMTVFIKKDYTDIQYLTAKVV